MCNSFACLAELSAVGSAQSREEGVRRLPVEDFALDLDVGHTIAILALSALAVCFFLVYAHFINVGCVRLCCAGRGSSERA